VTSSLRSGSSWREPATSTPSSARSSSIRTAALEPLSERERDVLYLLALGHTNQEIGKQLFISVRTVDTHRAHIMRKLQLDTRAQLVMFALANGVIGPSVH
jgi:DNA-binding NarL/FixJ family response regulator